MRDLFFVIKTFIFTLIIVLLLQIKLGEDTLENRALAGLRDSEAALSLQAVSVDGFQALRQIAAQVTKSLSQTFGSKQERSSLFKFGRSEAYKEEQTSKKSAGRADD